MSLTLWLRLQLCFNVKKTSGMNSSYLRTHKTMYYMTMFAVSIFTFGGIGGKAAIWDFFSFYDYNFVLM